MYIPWEWIREKIKYNGNYPVGKFIEQLNYYGLECEQNFTDGILLINFIAAHNRKDLKSWWGLIREISILLDLKKTINFFNTAKEKCNWLDTSSSNLQLLIKSKQVVGYNILSLHNLTRNKCLPAWMLQSLAKNGVKSINPIVDIANFTSLETGQPFHVFDLEKLQDLSAGKEIIIKEAAGGELFVDLSAKEWKLRPGNLLAETNGKVVELMGIIGGNNAAVNQTTKQILVESAHFSAKTIEQTCNELGIRTRSSEVFVNSHNQENLKRALERFEEIISEFYVYQKEKTEYFSLPHHEEEMAYSKLEISVDFLERKLGTSISERKIETILERLEFPFERKNNLYIVKVPSFRSDLQIREDLLEEIGKLLDYNLLPEDLPASQNQFIDLQFNNTYNFKRKIAFYLMSNGYQEILSYSLTEDTYHDEEGVILLTNPNSRARAAYRTSFINSHLEIVKHNQGQKEEDLFFFEMGSVYSKKNNSSFPVSEEILSVIAIGKIINSQPHQLSQQVDLYWVKGLLENLLVIMNIDEFILGEVEFTSSADFDYPLLIKGERMGFIRQLSPKTLLQNKIQKKESFVLQLSFGKLFSLSDKQEEKKYIPVSYLPIITKNISFLVKKTTPLGQIVEVIRKQGGEFLLEVSLVDIYDKEEKSTLYSLNFQLLFQGRNVNLQNAEVEVKIEEIWEILIGKFSVLRR